jgi:hypothetical protein
MKPDRIETLYPPETKRFDCNYELLFSETRPPNFVQSSPQHTVTMARSSTALRLYLRNEEARKATETAIRNGTLKFVELSEDILAIQAVDHADGWPYREHVHTRTFQNDDRLRSADIYFRFYVHDFYETPESDDGVTVLSNGPMKMLKWLLFEEESLSMSVEANRVFLHTSRRESSFHILLVFLKDEQSAERLGDTLAKGGNTVLVPNDVVRSILLVPRPAEPTATMFAYGVETMPEKDINALKELQVQKLPSGVWAKPGWTLEDERKLFKNLTTPGNAVGKQLFGGEDGGCPGHGSPD